MDYIIKKASSFSSEELISLGIVGVPANWPILAEPYVDTVPETYELISEENLNILKANNKVAYDAWLAAKMTAAPLAAAQLVNVSSIPSFSAKTVTIGSTTKKLFARNTGFQHTMSVGANTVTYTLSYPWCKILGVEVIGAETLDYCDLEVFDTAAGTYSGVPNYKLNQFAYSVNIPMNYYIRLSQFDADIYQGMVIKITYNSVSAKTVGFNIIMNELKD